MQNFISDGCSACIILNIGRVHGKLISFASPFFFSCCVLLVIFLSLILIMNYFLLKGWWLGRCCDRSWKSTQKERTPCGNYSAKIWLHAIWWYWQFKGRLNFFSTIYLSYSSWLWVSITQVFLFTLLSLNTLTSSFGEGSFTENMMISIVFRFSAVLHLNCFFKLAKNQT